MRNGFFAGDEFWLWVDARTSKSQINKIVSNILLKSRKRDLTYCFTSQLLDLLDKRVRKVMDFTCYPLLNRDESICRATVFRTGYPTGANRMKEFYFQTPLFFDCYDHQEEISPLDIEETNSHPQIIFQTDPKSSQEFFDTWEAADKYAEKWWNENFASLKGRI
jgi:hypothetical protein